MELHLVCSGRDCGIAKEQLEFGDRHVRCPDVSHQTSIHESLHLLPGGHIRVMDIARGIAMALGYVGTSRMMIRERPVHQVQIEIVELEIPQALFTRCFDLVVHVVPHLRGDPQLVSVDASRFRRRQARADQVLVAIDRSTIEVAVSPCASVDDRRRYDIMGDAV